MPTQPNIKPSYYSTFSPAAAAPAPQFLAPHFLASTSLSEPEEENMKSRHAYLTCDFRRPANSTCTIGRRAAASPVSFGEDGDRLPDLLTYSV